MAEHHTFRLQLIATPGANEGELECVLLVELPRDDFDPLDYLAFLQASRDKTAALYEEELDRIATTYAELQDISIEDARIELSDIVCEQGGLALEAGVDQESEIIPVS